MQSCPVASALKKSNALLVGPIGNDLVQEGFVASIVKNAQDHMATLSVSEEEVDVFCCVSSVNKT